MVLAFNRSADAAEFERRFIVQASVRFDLAAQKTQKGSEIVIKNRPGQVHDTGPVIAGGVSRRVDEAAPLGNAFYDCEQVPDLSGFERGSLDSRLVQQESGIEEAAEFETPAARKHRLHICRALLLLVDPVKVRAWLQC